ncbi:MAG: NAD(P)H-hydrate dehydratase [Tannerellaceae bacterium]|nr:NAD(P)H-hydrate dehydratase [Tannerellaceae bacterium]
MTKIFFTEQVKILDQYTITNEPILPIDLVERAATLFLHEFCRRFSKQKRIVVFAGQGNNGADALAIARLLKEESYKVETYLLNPSEHLSVECEINKERLLGFPNHHLTEVIADFTPPALNEQDVVIDGLFGSGLNRPLTGGFAAVVNYINQAPSTIVSIDIPSGLFGEDNRNNDPDAIIKADITLSFGFPKLSFLFPENEMYVGDWKVLDINIHPDIIHSTQTPYSLITEEDISSHLIKRKKFSHKGTFGHALLIAGSRGKMGAALLSAKACLHAGAGMLTAHIPRCGETILQTAFPECMVSLDKHEDFFTQVPDLRIYDAIGIGPGLGKRLESSSAMEHLLQYAIKPLVIDADALNLIAANLDLFNRIPKRSILTPHPKEFDRLAGKSSSGYERLMKAKSYAEQNKFIVILKGAYTAICTPEGNVYFNSTGNPGMATAGSGDILTGIILGLLAQGYHPEVAADIGVYLHGVAGDLAAVYSSEESMVSGDIIAMLGKAFKQIR